MQHIPIRLNRATYEIADRRPTNVVDFRGYIPGTIDAQHLYDPDDGEWTWGNYPDSYHLEDEFEVLIEFNDGTYGICGHNDLFEALAALGYESLQAPRRR